MLRYLLNFWLGPIMLMFAAGAIVDAGASGGGDGGSEAGGDAGAGDGGADPSDAGGGAGDEGGGENEFARDDSSTDGAQDQDPNATVDLGDGRTAPAKWKKAFELAKQAGVEKEVKQAFFGINRLTKVIPGGINGAIELARSVEEFGGVEGIQQLQSDLDIYHQDSELFEHGDPKWTETAFQENPDITLKHFANALNYVSEHHGEFYDHVIAKALVADMGENLHVHDIYGILAGLKDNPQAQELAKELAKYYNDRHALSQKVPEKKVDAQQKALTDKEMQLEKQTMDLRFTQVATQTQPSLRAAVTRTLQAEAKVRGIDLAKLSKDYAGEWQDMLTAIHNDIKNEVAKDGRFLDKYFALVKKGDIKRAQAAINAKHEDIIPDVARKTASRYGIFKGKKVDAGKGGARQNDAANAAASAGWIRVGGPPEKYTVDWSKTTIGMKLDGKAVLKNGKKVTWG